MSKEFKFKIGADPEFNLELYNKRVNAKETIHNLLKTNPKFETAPDGYKVKGEKYGSLGWDGHSSTGEIRPSAANTPEAIIENLRGIFKEFNLAGPLFEISTLSRTASAGGHIHFELPPGRTSDERMKGIHKRMISFYLPIIMGENKTNLAIRMKTGYGKLCTNNAYRVEQHFTREDGSAGYTYELRCPSAEWMATPKIAKSTLAYLGVVYHEIMKHPKKFEATCNDIIIRVDKQGDALQELAMAEYKPLTQAVFNKIKKYIKTFELYPEFKEEIEYILKPQQVIVDKQAANFDIRIGWQLIKETKEASKRTILSENAFKKKIKEKDLDTMSQLVNVGYNEDANVDTFAQRLTQTVAAFNWNLNKHYFLYGIRKGIDGYIIANSTKATIVGKDSIKTILDDGAIEALVGKMRIKARDLFGTEGITKRINFKTGKQEAIKKEIILIGIPYQDRIENKTNKFVELIYDIDKGNVKQPKKNNKSLINDTELTLEEQGKIYKILNKLAPIEASIEASVPDTSSDQATQESNLNEIMREHAAIERETEDLIENPTEFPDLVPSTNTTT